MSKIREGDAGRDCGGPKSQRARLGVRCSENSLSDLNREDRYRGMTRGNYEVLERAACLLATGAEPIKERMTRACELLRSLRSEELANHPELKVRYEDTIGHLLNQTGDHACSAAIEQLTEGEAQCLAGTFFDMFVESHALVLPRV